MFAQEISYYKLIKKIGAGGMGEVYLAEDTRLNRKVALKILPENFSKDRKQLSRFLREASLAANLNHSNICIIYEVNDATDVPFIAMEYVEGETLFDKIQNNSLSLCEILEIAVQVSDALDEAHGQGVIHRDIKSANIIINRRGLAKILDFGLAKTIIEESSDEAVTRAKTEAGILVGTVRYMSPEQALGKTLDGRTDLWSLGVLLYEMLGGKTPFKGDTQVAIFDEILHKQPDSLTQTNENIPLELEKIIFKLLEKDREFRYQTASDLRADLKRLQRNTDEINIKISENRHAENNNFHQTAFVKVQTDGLLKQKTENIELNETKRSFWLSILIGFISLVFLTGLGAAAYQFAWKTNPTISFAKRETQRITNLGKVLDALISTDGKYLVYVQDEGELQSLWVKQLATGSIAQLVPPTNVVYQGLTISSDSSWIYYNIWDRKSVGQIFRVPILGGIPQKIIHDCMPGVGISPDNQQIAFIRSYDKERKQDLIVANIESREEKPIKSSGWEGGIYAFAWSPDGQSLAIISNTRDESGEGVNLLTEISVVDQSEKSIWQVPSKVRNLNSGLTWKPDKSGILITIAESEDLYSQIWEISYPSGEARQLTKDFNSYGRLSVTADGKNLVSVQQEVAAGLWILPVDNPLQAQRITNSKLEGMDAGWTSDGKVIYTSTVSGNVDIWMVNEDGSNKKQLTSDAFIETAPCVTRDGKTIAFSSNRNNNWNIWLMNTDGTNQRRLLENGMQWGAYCSKLENSFFFYGIVNKKEGIWKVPLIGGEPTFIWDKSPFPPNISPDEKQLAYSLWNEDRKRLEQEIYTLATGKAEKVDLPDTAVGEDRKEPSLKWTPDGRNISFLNEEKTNINIWIKSLTGGKLKKVSNFNENRVFGYDWSPDGKKILVLRGVVSTDVVLIKEDK